MSKNGEATLLLRIKQIGQEILDRFVITFGDVVNIAKSVAAALGETIEAFREQEDAVNQLNQSMINQGTFSADLQRKYLDMAGALQKVTTFGDEQIISAQAILQAHIGNREVTEDLVKATLNLATAKKMDLSSAAELVGKSISSETNMLARQGIHLDESIAKHDRLAAVIQAVDGKTHGYAEAAAKGLGSTVTLKNAFGELMEVIGEKLAPIVTSFSIKLADLFFKISEWAGSNSLAKKSTVELGSELFKLQERLEKLAKWEKTSPGSHLTEIEAVKKKYEEIALLQQKQFDDEALALQNSLEGNERKRKEAFEKRFTEKIAEDQALADLELAQIGTTDEQKLQAQISYLNKKIQNEENFLKKQEMVKLKGAVTEQLIDEKRYAKEKEERDKADKQQVADRGATLSTIATMARSNNSTLAAIGKAAAITQIAIETPVAIAKALAAFPPPFNFVAAGLVGTAMAAQAANIAGVQLAEGGIVRASQGGTLATIGEGGRDEAVIPLEDGRVPGMGSSITIVVNGGLMGDEQQAREFARVIDRQLYKLRLNNESVSFDGIS